MADETLRCQDCGNEFTLSQSVRSRYPNWTPRTCMSCRNGEKRAAKRPVAARTGARTGSAPGSLHTPAQVLERYDGGPQDGVFTDGSCSGNPGPGGWGAVRVRSGRILEERHGADPSTTNNRMELTAMIEGLRMLAPDESTSVYSDSQLVVNTLTKWAAGWEQRGWKRKEGPVKNLDLVQQAWELARARPHARIQWIKAHDGSRWNEYADALATTYLRDTTG
ncbi:MAG: ribonuclease H [Dehalococcoidia bacterium]